MMRIKAYILPVLMVFGMIAGSQAQSPTRWRGPEGNGIYPDRDLAGKWPSGGPEILWSYEQLGKGHSSPVVAGNELYATGMIDSTGYLFRFDYPWNRKIFHFNPPIT